MNFTHANGIVLHYEDTGGNRPAIVFANSLGTDFRIWDKVVAGLRPDYRIIRYDKRGIVVNRGLVTTNRRVFAIGDVIGGAQFTHIANYHAGIVLKRALFRLPVRVNPDIYPWVTLTAPEIAHVGPAQAAAQQTYERRYQAVYQRMYKQRKPLYQSSREITGYPS